jgi:hypothetical protein
VDLPERAAVSLPALRSEASTRSAAAGSLISILAVSSSSGPAFCAPVGRPSSAGSSKASVKVMPFGTSMKIVTVGLAWRAPPRLTFR